MKIGVVDTGGGLRGIYAAGIFDRWLDLGIRFDVAVGVSAGSANLASFLARQSMRNHTFYTVYSQRPEYMSVRNFLRTRSYLDLEYIYGTLSRRGGEYPLDYVKMNGDPAEFIVVATDARTGKPRYFDKRDLAQDNYDPFKASSAIPFVCRPWTIGAVPYYDGALSDPIPFNVAFSRGCDRVVVILTKPKVPAPSSRLDHFFASRIKREFPNSAERMQKRYQTYNTALEQAQALEKAGRVLILSPDSTCGVKTLSRNTEALQQLHQKGYHDADAALHFISE